MTMRPLSSVLYLGSKGPDVERLQQALAARGYLQSAPSGIFGPDPEAAVQAFQRQSGLRVDGTVGPEVRAALFRDERLEQAAQAAIHASVQATATPGGVGVGQIPDTEGQQLTVSPLPDAPGNYKPLLIVGGLIVGALLLAAAAENKPSFGDYEDDNGLPPMLPGDDDEESDPGTEGITAAPVSETDIVPFGGGGPLKRGEDGKFLPREKEG